MSTPSTGPAISDMIGAHVTALTLRGMPFTASQLLGNAPQAVLRQYKVWADSGKKGLPRVLIAYYRALEPLGITRPSHPGVPVLELLLYAEIADAKAAREALASVMIAGKRAGKRAPLPTQATHPTLSPDVVASHEALVSSVKDFWRMYTRICQEIRDYIVAGDLHSTIVVFRRNEVDIQEVIDRIETSARSVATLHGRTSRQQADGLLGELVLPGEYVAPNLRELANQPAAPAPTPQPGDSVTQAVTEMFGAPPVALGESDEPTISVDAAGQIVAATPEQAAMPGATPMAQAGAMPGAIPGAVPGAQPTGTLAGAIPGPSATPAIDPDATSRIVIPDQAMDMTTEMQRIEAAPNTLQPPAPEGYGDQVLPVQLLGINRRTASMEDRTSIAAIVFITLVLGLSVALSWYLLVGSTYVSL